MPVRSNLRNNCATSSKLRQSKAGAAKAQDGGDANSNLSELVSAGGEPSSDAKFVEEEDVCFCEGIDRPKNKKRRYSGSSYLSRRDSSFDSDDSQELCEIEKMRQYYDFIDELQLDTA